MAWTSLSFAYGSVLTSTKMTQLYDNLTALANGDSGAPKVQTAGLATSCVTGAKVANYSLTESLHVTPAAGTTAIFGVWPDSIQTASGTTSYLKMGTNVAFAAARAGTFTVSWEQRAAANAGVTASVKIYKNDVDLGYTFTVTGTTWTAKTQDLTITKGDYLSFYGKTDNSGDYCQMKNIKVTANTGMLG